MAETTDESEPMQACSKCKTERPVSHYGRTGPGRRWSRCEACRQPERQHETRTPATPEQVRRSNLRRLYGITTEEYDRRRTEQGFCCAVCRRHEDELEARQTGRPRLDGSPSTLPMKLHVDHDHDTNEVRGLLCHNCNMGLGGFQDRAVRNATMLAILFGVGTRRAELVALDIDDIDPETGKTKIRGKGNKIRIGYCVGGTLDAIQEWIRVRGPQPGPLFVAVNKAGRLDPAMHRLSTQAVYALLVRLARKAGVRHLSPHDARRTFGGNLFDAGVDAPTVQRLFGHASLATTGKYDRRGEETKAAASGKLHIPYVPHGGGYGPSEGEAF